MSGVQTLSQLYRGSHGKMRSRTGRHPRAPHQRNLASDVGDISPTLLAPPSPSEQTLESALLPSGVATSYNGIPTQTWILGIGVVLLTFLVAKKAVSS